MEILNEIDETSKFYGSVRDAFRNGISDLYKVFEDYMACSLKREGIGVSNKTIRECIDIAVNHKCITLEFGEFYKDTLRVRNSFSHKYKQPSTEYLIEFYNENKEQFSNFIEHIEKHVIKVDGN